MKKIKEISTLTDNDYYELVSTFITFSQPKYRCSDCKLKYKNDDVKREKYLENMACSYYANKPRHEYNPDFNNKDNPKIKYKNCIGNHYHGGWGMFINFISKYNEGSLPFEGGLMEQPAKFVDVMNLVHNLISEKEQEDQKRQQSIERSRQHGKRSSKR